MWEKILQAIKDIAFVGELSRRNSDELKELRKRCEDLTLMVERLTFEVQRTRENEAHERQVLALEIEHRLSALPIPAPKKSGRLKS